MYNYSQNVNPFKLLFTVSVLKKYELSFIS